MNFGNDRNDDYKDDDDMEIHDDFDFDDEDEGGILRWASIVFVLAAIGGFVALAWYAYQSGMQPVSEDEIPYVSADEGSLKEKPEDPGGWQFEHQDKSVYNQLAAGKGGAERPVAERILPAPEEPVERPRVEQILPQDFEREEVAPSSVETPIAPTSAAEKAPEATSAKPETVKVEQETIAAPEQPVPAPVVEKETEVAEKPAAAPVVAEAPKPAPAPPAPKATPATGDYMVQLGAFGSDADARAAWSKVESAHGSAFPTKNYQVQRADLGAKGVFYRLQVGPFESETAARKVCAYLSQHNQGCFPVKK